MKVAPLDLRQQQFRTTIRGYDRHEVAAFLTEAADDYERALHEQDRLRHEVARVEAADGRADLLLRTSQARLEDAQREIDGLRMKRREVETSIEALVSTLNNTLEFVREQDVRVSEDTLLLHRQD